MRNCERFWRRNATADGFLDWRGFAGGLQSALRKHDTSETTAQLDLASARRPVALVTSGEIERFLSSCHSESLVKGLAVAGRDMHRWKVSIQKQESHRSGVCITIFNDYAKNIVHWSSSEYSVANGIGDCVYFTTLELAFPFAVVKQRSTETQVGSGHRHFTSLSVAREREELLRGAEVLQNTQKWFQNRLAVLSAEQQQRKIDQVLFPICLAHGLYSVNSWPPKTSWQRWILEKKKVPFCSTSRRSTTTFPPWLLQRHSPQPHSQPGDNCSCSMTAHHRPHFSITGLTFHNPRQL